MRFKLPSLSRMLKTQKKFRRIAETALKPRRARTVVAKTMLRTITTFGSNPGGLVMKLFVPDPKPAKPALVIILHGCRQTPESFDAATGFSRLARQRGFVLLYPQQRAINNAQGCFNWFRPSSVARDRGELMSVQQMIDHVCKRHAIDRSRIFIAGLSAGGTLAAALAATYPEQLAGVAIVAGMPFGAARDAMAALRAMRTGVGHSPEVWGDLVRSVSPNAKGWPPISIWHGSRDHLVNAVNAQSSVAQWLSVNRIEGSSGKTVLKPWGTLTEWKTDSRVQVSAYSLTGVGHGWPVRRTTKSSAVSGDQYVLEAGISAPLELLRIWGIRKE
jgi:poly(hydroxyalkanoate) depolymerase family esterase